MTPQEIRDVFINSFPYDDFMSQWLCDNLFVCTSDIETELHFMNDEEIEELYIDFLVDEDRFKGKNDS